MSIIESVATLLARHAQSKAVQPSFTRHDQSGSTAEHISALDNIFDDILASLGPIRLQFDNAAASLAQLSHSIDSDQETAVATALLSFRASEDLPLSPDTTAGQSFDSECVSSGSAVKKEQHRRTLTSRDTDPDPTGFRRSIASLPPLPLPISRLSALKPRHEASILSGGIKKTIVTPNQVSAVRKAPQRPPQDSESRGLAKKKRYRAPAPSTHCHICCRPSRSVPVAVCANITSGICRKSICSLCVREYNLGDWEQARRPESGWVCCHCQNGCAGVSRAQCFVYKRTNMKRKQASEERKRLKFSAPQNAGFGGLEDKNSSE